MNRLIRGKTLPSGSHWLMLIITGVLFALVATFVDLKPVVDENLFVSTSDPGVQQTKKIERSFPSQPEVILTASSRDISSARYLGKIQRLTQRVHTIGGVSAVKSLTEGPKSFEDALKSPFWSRLLIAPDRKSTNVIIFMKGRHTERPIQKLEQIVHELEARDFQIHIAGPSDGRLADDVSAFVLVDGVCLVRLRQSADRAGEAAARAGIRRRTRHCSVICVRLSDVSGVPALGCAAQEQDCRGRTHTCILVAPVCAALVRRDFARRGLRVWPEQGEHGP